MQSSHSMSLKNSPLAIEDYSSLLSRYQNLGLAQRAKTVLEDTSPAIETAEAVLKQIADNSMLPQALTSIRKNNALVSKLRPSDARNTLLDGSRDFIESTSQKLAAWRKTMQRLSQGEGIVVENNHEFIPQSTPLASAITGTACVSNYLAMIQLILGELTKMDTESTLHYTKLTAGIRRCATVLSDYENVSDIITRIH